MNLERESIAAAIKAEIVRIAATLDADASDLTSDELIPASGYIDSAGLLELVAWYEATYKFNVPPSDFTVDNLGSIDAMVDYVRASKGVR